jgi:hypothetical protein
VRKSAPIVDDGSRKVCSKCGTPLPLNAFANSRGSPDERRPDCRSCHSQYWIPYKVQAQPRQRDAHLRRTYDGFSDDDYQHLFELQRGLCASCGNSETVRHYGKLAPLATDHNHATGHVRGLLCQACNRALGLLRDDPERIEALLRYARSTSNGQ